MRALLLFALVGCARPAGPPPETHASASCASCHADHGDDHAASPHARAAASPLLAAMLPDVEEAWGSFARERCEGCHSPGHGPDDGVGCVSCHAAVGNHGTSDGRLAIDLEAPVGGPGESPHAPHPVTARGFLRAPELCGTCHELTGPRLAVEPTFTEFLASPQAAEGATCASCHMPAREGRRDHRFVGFDPPWGAGPEEAARSADDTLALLQAALRLDVRRDGDALGIAVTNVGAGHAVPTGAAFLRDLWVDVEVGAEGGGGVVAARVITLGDQPMRGERPVPLLTRADRVEPGSLPAGATRRARIAWPRPEPASVVLRGRAVRLPVLDALGLRRLEPELPVHEIARR